MPSCKGWGRGTPRNLEGDRQGGAEGVPKVGGRGATWGGGLERRVRLRGRQRARSPGHEAREGVRSGQGRRWRGLFFGGGSLTKGVTGRSGKKGRRGGSLKMGVGELWRAARGAGKLGVPGRASEPREPSRRHGGRPRAAAGRARGECGAGGGGERAVPGAGRR